MSYKGPPLQLTPPDKGSFPLDHSGVCKDSSKAFLSCLKQYEAESMKCRHLSKEFLKCRMENGLMAKENLDDLGFDEDSLTTLQANINIREEKAKIVTEKQETGFLAGMSTVQAKEERKR
jgi:cytochrome c oxidase assembly protein subunit 19